MKIVNVIIGVVGILVALAVWWGNRATDEANDMIKAGNEKFTLGQKFQNEALEKLTAVEAANFTTEIEKVRKLANEGAELYTKSGEQFREAAASFLKASETVHDATAKEYFTMEHQSTVKLAELQILFQKYLLIYTDPAIQDAETLQQKIAGPLEVITKSAAEFTALDAAAKKYKDDHKDKLVTLK